MKQLCTMDINNTCCCCLLRPADKYLKTPYTRLGGTEIYANMIKECFEIQVLVSSDEEYGICEVCVGRLRDATNFKLQVQRSLAELQGALHVKEEHPEKAEIADDEIGPDCPQELIHIHLKEELKTEVADDPLPSDDDKDIKESIIDEEKEPSEARKEHYKQSAESPLAKQKGDNIHETCFQDTPCDSEAQAQGHHEIVDLKKKPYTCGICGKRLPTRAGRNRHIARVHQRETEHICKICDKRFKRKSLLDMHKRIHTVGQPYGCEICNKRFKYKSGLLLHQRIHTSQVFVCDVCKTQFKHRTALVQHMGSHSGQTVWRCKFCHNKFFDRPSLSKHIRTEHDDNRYYICDECKRVFEDKYYFISHLKGHTEWNMYQCNICARTLSTESSLRRHKLIHTTERTYGCEICKKRFLYKAALTKHIPVHAAEKSHCCEKCGKFFVRSDYLRRHLRIHAEGTSFPCELCPKSYSTKECLRQHKRTHTKEKAVAKSAKKRQNKKIRT